MAVLDGLAPTRGLDPRVDKMGGLSADFVEGFGRVTQGRRLRLGDRQRQVGLADRPQREIGEAAPEHRAGRDAATVVAAERDDIARPAGGSAADCPPSCRSCRTTRARTATPARRGNNLASARRTQARWIGRPVPRSAPTLPNTSRPAWSKRNELRIWRVSQQPCRSGRIARRGSPRRAGPWRS